MTASIEMKKVVDISIFLLIVSTQTHSLSRLPLIHTLRHSRSTINIRVSLSADENDACLGEKFTLRELYSVCVFNEIRERFTIDGTVASDSPHALSSHPDNSHVVASLKRFAMTCAALSAKFTTNADVEGSRCATYASIYA